MCGPNDYNNILNNSRGRVFTLNEAVEFMKSLDSYATNHTVNWVSAKTGKPVAIGWG